jgi:hypothetical protein
MLLSGIYIHLYKYMYLLYIPAINYVCVNGMILIIYQCTFYLLFLYLVFILYCDTDSVQSGLVKVYCRNLYFFKMLPMSYSCKLTLLFKFFQSMLFLFKFRCATKTLKSLFHHMIKTLL